MSKLPEPDFFPELQKKFRSVNGEFQKNYHIWDCQKIDKKGRCEKRKNMKMLKKLGKSVKIQCFYLFSFCVGPPPFLLLLLIVLLSDHCFLCFFVFGCFFSSSSSSSSHSSSLFFFLFSSCSLFSCSRLRFFLCVSVRWVFMDARFSLM